MNTYFTLIVALLSVFSYTSLWICMIPWALINVPLPVHILNCSTVVVHCFEMRDRGHA